MSSAAGAALALRLDITACLPSWPRSMVGPQHSKFDPEWLRRRERADRQPGLLLGGLSDPAANTSSTSC